MRAIVLVLGLAVAGAAAAQEAAAPDPAGAGDEFRETQALIDRMQARIDAINIASSTRNKEIEYLNEQIARAIQMIASGREDNQNLLQTTVDIEEELRALFVAREDLTARLTEANEGRETVVANLNTEIAALSDLLDLERKNSADLGGKVARLTENLEASRADGEASERELAQSRETLASAMDLAQERQTTIEELMRGARESENEIASLTRGARESENEIASLTRAAQERENEIASLTHGTLEHQNEIASLTRAAQERENEIASLTHGTLEHQNEIASLTRAAQELRRALADARSGASDQAVQLALLRQDLADARSGASDQAVQLALLRQDLDAALADSARGLSRYRSEFFGRLRDALGDHPDIRTVGDRFVFQSEVLFESGSADLDSAGRQTLDKLADTLMQVTNTIPADVRWILRVDGHTDRVPIRNFRFESNWELSTARSVSVVKHLIDRGLPPDKLAATGFGEYRPMDPREDEIAYRRNRRIEFMLTSR